MRQGWLLLAGDFQTFEKVCSASLQQPPLMWVFSPGLSLQHEAKPATVVGDPLEEARLGEAVWWSLRESPGQSEC